MPVHPIPINSAEAILESFWDPRLSTLEQWRFQADAHTDGSVSAFWFGPLLQWQRGGGQIVACLSRAVDFAIAGYDHLHLCISLPASSQLDLRATIDGCPQQVIQSAVGQNGFAEYEGPIAGARIEQIELVIRDAQAAPGAARLMWLGVYHESRRQALRRPAECHQVGLEQLILAADQRPQAAPTLGLFFATDDLDALRRKVATPPYAPLAAELRRVANLGAASEPWRGIGRFPNEGGPRGGRGGNAGHIHPLTMRLGALMGLLDDDPQLCRLAVRHALALAHCEYWVPDFLEAFPGSSFEQRAFFDYRYAMNLVFAWDWAGSYLTPAGSALLAHALATKALPRLHMTLMRHAYIRGCNQGAYFAFGTLLCLAALQKVWPHVQDYVEPAARALDQTMETYLGPDGGAFEGMGYVSSTLGHALVAYQLLARLRGQSLAQVVPPRVSRAARYITTMLSTAPPLGAAINVADGGRPGATLYPECLPFLAQLSDEPALPALLEQIIGAPLKQESFATPGAAFCLLFGPDFSGQPLSPPLPPVFSVLEHTGQLCSCRNTPQGPVRLQLIGAPARAGHAHQDKGSFVLEAFGEEIAIDRGQMDYADARCSLIGQARYHNLLVPLDESGAPRRQVNPCSTAVLPQGQGNADQLHALVDASAAWGPGARWVRRIDSTEARHFAIIDELDLPAPAAATFYLHSRFPWIQSGAAWTTTGRRAQLTVAPDWSPQAVSAGEDFVDGSKIPAYTLALQAPSSSAHRLCTRLTVALSEANPSAL